MSLIRKICRLAYSIQEWVVAARKEGVWLSMRAKSKQELLTRLCANKFGSAWHIQLGEGDPEPLIDWLRREHPATRGLEASPESGE